MGRQEGACDHPYVPVEEMEKAIVSFYNSRAWLPHQFLSEVRAGVDAALSENLTLSKDLRHQHAARLEVLDNKENYLLDLAAEEGWPKEKLRTKIAAIRRERQDIESTLTCARQQLDTSAISSTKHSTCSTTQPGCTPKLTMKPCAACSTR